MRSHWCMCCSPGPEDLHTPPASSEDKSFHHLSKQEETKPLPLVKQERVERGDCNLDLKVEVNIRAECGLSAALESSEEAPPTVVTDTSVTHITASTILPSSSPADGTMDLACQPRAKRKAVKPLGSSLTGGGGGGGGGGGPVPDAARRELGVTDGALKPEIQTDDVTVEELHPSQLSTPLASDEPSPDRLNSLGLDLAWMQERVSHLGAAYAVAQLGLGNAEHPSASFSSQGGGDSLDGPPTMLFTGGAHEMAALAATFDMAAAAAAVAAPPPPPPPPPTAPSVTTTSQRRLYRSGAATVAAVDKTTEHIDSVLVIFKPEPLAAFVVSPREERRRFQRGKRPRSLLTAAAAAMSSRLAFQTQLASIMEVLANAAVAEICKLVDDDYAVVSLQMSQCQRENKALKRKLHLLELKMARGAAERRLRDSAANSSRPRVQIRESSSSTGGAFERQMNMSLWSSGGAAAGDAANQPIHSDDMQCKSPDVQLVEPEQLLVKEESVEANKVEEMEEDVSLIRDDGVLERIHRGASGQRASLEQDAQSQSQTQTSRTRPPARSSRGVEKEEEPDVVLVKVEEAEPVTGTDDLMGLSIQEGLVESSTDDYRGALAVDEATPAPINHLSELQESDGSFSESAPVMSEDSSSVVAVQLHVPDTNTPANPSAEQQQQQPAAQRSEYSLFELETFFTRWAPDVDSASASTGPSCSFSTDDSADCDPDEVTIVETELPGSSAGVAMGVSSAAVASTAHVQPTEPRAGASASVHVRMQVPSSQCPWSRTTAMMRRQQHSRLSAPSSSANSSGDKPSVSLPAGESPGIAAQHRVPFLAHHSESQAASIAFNDRRRKNYVCRACGKAFPGLSNLEAHERVHTGEKPFRCNTCGKHFSEAGNLKKHQRVHTGEKPFSCNQCGKRFAWICNLRTHQQSATGCGPQIGGGLGLS
ncbi:transcriptional regulator CRZ2-like [Solea senegalensis]|uniref:Transcriptional regulator CRZ2-like n=1 Tax=Solea senegalensis TaxID=28829 RepID=A0AAV6QDY9_SOLSE|nr:transcriptional regulator CRZ2-like [Solea senegalensis]